MFNADYMIYYAITAVMSLIGAWVSNRLQSKFKQYSEVRLRSNMSGKDVAEKTTRAQDRRAEGAILRDAFPWPCQRGDTGGAVVNVEAGD